MKADAEAHAGEDEKRKNLVDAKNHAEQLAYTAEKALKDAGDKAPADVVTEVNEKIAALKAVREGEDLDAIKAATDALSAALSKIGEAMMSAQQEASGSAAGAADAQGPAEAKDADFSEKPEGENT